jgi:hypothetical protein
MLIQLIPSPCLLASDKLDLGRYPLGLVERSTSPNIDINSSADRARAIAPLGLGLQKAEM